jgi:hypothetical protein
MLLDGVIDSIDGKIVSTSKVRHILGVASRKKRSMKSVAAHERLHVIWDEDEALRKDYFDQWNKLNDIEKNKIISNLKGYFLEKEDQLIEEWAVRDMENRYKR